jgi:predicted membrane GTPase involved in stress response
MEIVSNLKRADVRVHDSNDMVILKIGVHERNTSVEFTNKVINVIQTGRSTVGGVGLVDVANGKLFLGCNV